MLLWLKVLAGYKSEFNIEDSSIWSGDMKGDRQWLGWEGFYCQIC